MNLKLGALPSLIETVSLPPFAPGARQSRAAIKRCCTAWQRAHDAYMERTVDKSPMMRAAAILKAAPAYCRAMPPLAGYENIRDFIACTAHGLLVEAIDGDKANQLLYAARVALSSLNHEPKPAKSA
jgi:hypothetical protein